MKTNEIIDTLSRVVLFTIGGMICLGSYEIALRLFGVMVIMTAVGNELKHGQNEN